MNLQAATKKIVAGRMQALPFGLRYFFEVQNELLGLMWPHDYRTATDLDLHRLSPKKQATEHQELEMLDCTRTWINCFNLDKSTAIQFGKPSTLKEDKCALSCYGLLLRPLADCRVLASCVTPLSGTNPPSTINLYVVCQFDSLVAL